MLHKDSGKKACDVILTIMLRTSYLTDSLVIDLEAIISSGGLNLAHFQEWILPHPPCFDVFGMD